MFKRTGNGTTWHRRRHLRTRATLLPIVLTCLAAGLPWRMPVAVAESAGFVKAVGARFMLDGAPHYFAGANFWQGMNLGMDGAAGGDRERLGHELDRMQALGLVNLLHEMNRRNMRAVMTLNNYWHWSGGMAQYVAWAEGASIPYPPSHSDFTGDYATCHIWPQNWGWYQPDRPGTYAAGLQNALDYLRTHANLAATALGKPLVLEEFGLARDGGSLDPAAATTFRDDFFARHYAAVEENAEAGGALAGDNLWAWAGEGRPGDPSPQWIGDPPHETPGWYSVYDADAATLLVLAAHADQLACLSDDRDRDGLPDSWEWWRFGSLTRTSGEARDDGDGDGASDRNEYLAGTDANDAKDYLAIRGLQRVAAPPAMHLSWNTVTGRLYTVTIATNPCEPFGAAPDFVDRVATGTSMTYTNEEAMLPGTRFYRIQVRPPW